MSAITAIVAELVGAGLCGEDLIAAIGRIEAAGGFVTNIVTGAGLLPRRGRPGNPESAGARRTRLWRDRQASIRTGITVMPFVTAISGVAASSPLADGVTNQPVSSQLAAVVTICDAEPKKEVPPHPLKKKPTPQGPLVSAQRHKPAIEARREPGGRGKRRNPFEAGTPAVDPRQHVPGNTSLHFELLRLSGKASVPGGTGWYWRPEEIAEAERRLQSVVTPLRPPASQQDPPMVEIVSADTG